MDGNSAAGVGTGDGCAGPTRGGSGFVAVGARACRRSHALLPDFLLARRLDEAEVIGRALVLAIVIGLGMRTVADQVNVHRNAL